MNIETLKAKLTNTTASLNAAKAQLADYTAESEARILQMQTQANIFDGACQQLNLLIQEEENELKKEAATKKK